MPVSFKHLHDLNWNQIRKDFDASLARELEKMTRGSPGKPRAAGPKMLKRRAAKLYERLKRVRDERAKLVRQWWNERSTWRREG